MRLAHRVFAVCGALVLVLGVASFTPAQSKSAKAPQGEQGKAGKEADTVAAAQRGRRDPFASLVAPGTRAGQQEQQQIRPPGPAGLDVATLRVDGVVRASVGMIAVVSSPQGRVYFVREGTRLWNGTVERITMDGLVLRERGQDAFGNPVERTVVKRLYPSAGE